MEPDADPSRWSRLMVLGGGCLLGCATAALVHGHLGTALLSFAGGMTALVLGWADRQPPKPS